MVLREGAPMKKFFTDGYEFVAAFIVIAALGGGEVLWTNKHGKFDFAYELIVNYVLVFGALKIAQYLYRRRKRDKLD
jgi:hypothetical protein